MKAGSYSRLNPPTNDESIGEGPVANERREGGGGGEGGRSKNEHTDLQSAIAAGIPKRQLLARLKNIN